MKLRSLLLTVIALLFIFNMAVAGPNPDSWVGLWKITQATPQGPSEIFLFVPKNSGPQLWDAYWAPLRLVESRLESDTVHLNWVAHGFNTAVDAERQEDSFQGKWYVVHPQYRTENGVTGRKIFERASWNPLDAVGVGQAVVSLVDLNSYLKTKKPPEKDFESFWKEDFSPDFYALIGEAPPAEEVKRVFELSSFEKSTTEMQSEVEAVIDELEASNEGFFLPATIVLVPFGGTEPRKVWVGERRFVLVDAIQLAREINTGLSRGQLAYRLFAGALERELLGARGQAFDYFRAGVPLYLTSTLKSFDSIGTVLGLSASQFEEMKKDLPRIKGQIQKQETVTAQARRFVSYDFVKSMIKGTPVAELVKMNPRAVSEGFQKYLSN